MIINSMSLEVPGLLYLFISSFCFSLSVYQMNFVFNSSRLANRCQCSSVVSLVVIAYKKTNLKLFLNSLPLMSPDIQCGLSLSCAWLREFVSVRARVRAFSTTYLCILIVLFLLFCPVDLSRCLLADFVRLLTNLRALVLLCTLA